MRIDLADAVVPIANTTCPGTNYTKHLRPLLEVSGVFTILNALVSLVIVKIKQSRVFPLGYALHFLPMPNAESLVATHFSNTWRDPAVNKGITTNEV